MSTSKASHATWTEVDRTDDPQFFVHFLDATRAPAAAMARQDPAAFFAYLDVHPGQSVLDAGCELGEMARIIAGLVGPSGRVVLRQRRNRSSLTSCRFRTRAGCLSEPGVPPNVAQRYTSLRWPTAPMITCPRVSSTA